MIETACQCPDGFGVAHSHVFKNLHVLGPGPIAAMEDTGWVRLWIDWKAVARA